MRHRILFADDDVLSQWIMTEVLSEAGFSVSGVCRASDAMRLIDAGHLDFDVLLTDVELPDDHGAGRLVRAWRRAFPVRPIIITGPASYRPALVWPDAVFVAKPFSAGRMLSMLDFALSGNELPAYAPETDSHMQHVH